MKILFIGFGSIAKKHLENLKTLFAKEELTIDIIKKTKLIEEKYRNDIRNLWVDYKNLNSYYDVIFITNPTDSHYEALNHTIKWSNNFFVEKPVFNDINYDIGFLEAHEDKKIYVACPLRYNPVIQYIAKSININSIYSVRSICSSYLPNWRVDSDYRKNYTCKKENGGVAIDLIHELDYLLFLFGLPEKLVKLEYKVSNLEIEAPDLAMYIGKFATSTIELHLDYFGRENTRKLEFITEKGTIVGNLLKQEIVLEDGEIISFENVNILIEELKYFFAYINGKEVNGNNISTALNTLKLALEGKE